MKKMSREYAAETVTKQFGRVLKNTYSFPFHSWTFLKQVSKFPLCDKRTGGGYSAFIT